MAETDETPEPSLIAEQIVTDEYQRVVAEQMTSIQRQRQEFDNFKYGIKNAVLGSTALYGSGILIFEKWGARGLVMGSGLALSALVGFCFHEKNEDYNT